MDQHGIWSVSDVLNHLYCNRITWWAYVLDVPQRGTVKTRKGAEVHERWSDREARRRYEGVRLKVRRKLLGLRLRSERLGLSGRLDALLTVDGQVIPWDAKNTARPARPWPGQVIQMGAYALLLEDAFPGQRTSFGIVQYLQDGTTTEVPIDDALRAKVVALIDEMNEIRRTERMPDRAPPAKCRDCVYAKRCI